MSPIWGNPRKPLREAEDWEIELMVKLNRMRDERLKAEKEAEERDQQWAEGERMGYPVIAAEPKCPHCGVLATGMNSNPHECLHRPCDDCGHPVYLHKDKYGCQFERGDAWVDGVSMGGWVAQGPCGCTSHGL